MGIVQTVSFGKEDSSVMMQFLHNSYPSDQSYLESREVGPPHEMEKMKNSDEDIKRLQLWL